MHFAALGEAAATAIPKSFGAVAEPEPLPEPEAFDEALEEALDEALEEAFFGPCSRKRPSALATATTIAMRRSLMSLSMFGGCFLLFERECECGREGGMGECIHVGARWGAEG